MLQHPSVFELLAFEDVDLFGVLVHSSWKRKKKSHQIIGSLSVLLKWGWGRVEWGGGDINNIPATS